MSDFVTNDAKQMNRKLEVEAIAESGLHRIQYPHRQDGLAGLGLATATVCAALPSVLQELDFTRSAALASGWLSQ
jgi:hypothetical protein